MPRSAGESRMGAGAPGHASNRELAQSARSAIGRAATGKAARVAVAWSPVEIGAPLHRQECSTHGCWSPPSNGSAATSPSHAPEHTAGQISKVRHSHQVVVQELFI